MAQSCSWCFTIPNYTDGTLQSLRALSGSGCVAYLVFGREVAPTTGTPHLQGYVRFNTRKRFACVRRLLPQCHLTSARGSPQQNRDYCCKDGDYEEFGVSPVLAQGRRTDFDRYVEWIQSLPGQPTERELILHNPSLYGRYARSLRAISRELAPRPVLRDGELRPWQADLYTRLQGEANDRTVEFIVDRDGGLGKSWFCGYVFSQLPECQLLGPGKRDDLAHAVDERSRIFLFNVPRGQMEYLNYGLLEMLKDRMVLSPKYDSQMKILRHTPHVVVFSNEDPDDTKMTEDRYDITHIRD